MAEAIGGAVAPAIFKRCVDAAAKHLRYIWNYKKNMANLEEQVKKFDDRRNDMNHSVVVAERNAERIRDGVKSWQKGADKTSEEAKQIIRDWEEKGKKKCLMGLCPNPVSRYKFSKIACRKETR